MGIGRAHQEEVDALFQCQGTKGLLAVEIIAKQGHVMGRDRVGMGAEPPCAGHLFAVLLLMAILRHDVLWREGDDLGASGAYHHRGDDRVIIPRVTVGELTPETMWAREHLGGHGSRAIHRHEELIPEDPEPIEQVVLGQARKDLEKDGSKMVRRNGIEEGAHLIVAGNLLHATQGVGVIVPGGVLPSTLVR